MTTDIRPGLLVLHGNRLETLRDTVLAWLARAPLGPLEEEVFLVQSNGAAEWLKMSLAEAGGVCAATRVELPARFLWRTCRQVLGAEAVPAQSGLDKSVLGWRLLRLLPGLLGQPVFAPIARFLQGEGVDRPLQLALRLADLFDGYQVHRADWLAAWAAGRDVLIGPDGRVEPVPAEQAWQPLLWRACLAELDETERHATRPEVHRRVVQALRDGHPPASPLPRRVVLFGAAQVPGQTLEALAALAGHSQVLLAVPNPCRYHWADIIDGRELLRAARRRLPQRGADLAAVPLEAMHAHAHPLLAAWGRQGRDFMRALDHFDDAERSRAQFDIPRIDLFDDEPGPHLLGQVQAAIRDLLPLAEHAFPAPPAEDRSLVFHVAHSAQREVEILHDQLLALLADPPGGQPLAPRDIVVMVPDIERFVPAIRAVFGQVPREDARYLPFDIADLRQRESNPLVMALDWLLDLPQQRFRQDEVLDLLDVPAVGRRLGLDEESRARLGAWIAGAGVRWGLHAEQRAGLGLQACGDQNSWAFGLRRLLLGYASGRAGRHDGIEPHDEVGGLEAEAVGALADLVQLLDDWWTLARRPAPPAVWAERGRALMAALFDPSDEREKLTLAALQSALGRWLADCELAAFDEAVPLAVLREAWLGGLDAPGGNSRFLAGGVTFCTLMPLRAVPFEVVCLLGMNDGDYPRQSSRSDFDLLGLPGQARPGDRARRDDDRYLMLEALVSARRVFYVSWTGRSARDNSEQPPSVLVSQLRDYLVAGWPAPAGSPEDQVLRQRTTHHPLQPFSRRYFEGGGLATFAREWRQAHAEAGVAADPTAGAPDTADEAPLPPDPERRELDVEALRRFLANPAKAFFRLRLDVVFREEDEAPEGDESFGLDGLQAWQMLSELVADPAAVFAADPQGEDPMPGLRARAERLRGQGRLPLGELGQVLLGRLLAQAAPMLTEWQQWHSAYPEAAHPLAITHRDEATGLPLRDWLDGLLADGGAAPVWLSMVPGNLLKKTEEPELRPDKLILPWVRSLVAAACEQPLRGVLIGRDATLQWGPMAPEVARDALQLLLAGWQQGLQAPLPTAPRTAIEWLLDSGKADEAYDGGFQIDGEVRDECLARLWPDFEALSEQAAFEPASRALYQPMLHWAQREIEIRPHPQPEGLADPAAHAAHAAHAVHPDGETTR